MKLWGWFVCLGVGLCAVALPTVAEAAGWEATFGADPVATYLDQDGMRYIVVAAGEQPGTSRAATNALSTALRAGGRTKLVMGGESLGNVAGLDDQTIVTRVKDLPVDRVVVVRVFDAGPGNPQQAVVVMYDKGGDVVGALNGSSGAAIAPKVAEGTSQGVSSRAANAVSSVSQRANLSTEEAEAEYNRQCLSFDGWVAVTSGGGVVSWSTPYQGIPGVEISHEEFFHAVGRADLAESYNTRMTTRLSLILGGIVLEAGGLALFLLGPDGIVGDGGFGGSLSGPVQIVGLSMAGVGMLAAVVGFYIDPHPVSIGQAARMAEDHNDRLKRRLGLAAAGGVPPSPDEPALELSFAPLVSPSFQGGALTLSF